MEIDELQRLVKELRDKVEEKGRTEAELKELQEKLNARIDELEAKLMRPPLGETKSVEPSETKRVFFKYLRNGKAGLAPEERKALVESSNGQILVPEEVEAELYRQLPTLTVIRQLATVKQVRSDRVRRRGINEVKVGWGKLELNAQLESDNLQASERYTYIEDLYGLATVGEDELMDTDVNLQRFITDSFARVIAEKEEEAFINGHGHTYSEPEGIFYGDQFFPGIEFVKSTTHGVLTADDILKLIYAVPAQYRMNGTLLVNSKTEYAMRIMKDTVNGQYLWQPSLQAGRPATFAGYPVLNSEFIPNIEDKVGVAIFGDFKSGYVIYDRLGITIQRLDELFATQGLVGFKAHFRVGAAVVRPDAIKALDLSPETTPPTQGGEQGGGGAGGGGQ